MAKRRKSGPRMAALLRTELAAVVALRVLCKSARQPSSADSEPELEGALEALSTATVAQASARPVLGALACAPGAIASLCDLVQVLLLLPCREVQMPGWMSTGCSQVETVLHWLVPPQALRGEEGVGSAGVPIP